MDRFDAMQAFVRVVEAGSFTKAAETLRTSRSTVSQLIGQLEAHLRVKLLHRTTRQVAVTADGAAYYERVVRLLGDLDDAETSLSSAAAAPRGRLRVDVPSPFARTLLRLKQQPQLLQRIHHPAPVQRQQLRAQRLDAARQVRQRLAGAVKPQRLH